MPFDADAVRHAYEAIADGYAERFGDELERSAFGRAVLDDAIASTHSSARMMDLGCGPGHIAAYLRAHGQGPVVGVDLTPAMLRIARTRLGDLALAAGDALSLPFRDAAFGAVVAWFSLHNFPRALLGQAFAEVRRVVQSGGVFVLCTHAGDGEDVVESDRDGQVERVVITYYRSEELTSVAARSGFEVRSVRSRPPMENEHQVMKVCLTATAR
jgi:ubiquinone/menaquinone biosynthesis C-methylase UbiE